MKSSSGCNEIVKWVTSRLGVPDTAYGLNPLAICRRNAQGEIVVGIVYGPFNGYNVHAHIASNGSRKWMTRKFLHEMFRVPFEDMGATGITVTTDHRNRDSIRFVTRLGFEFRGSIPRGSNEGGDLLIYYFGRDKWNSRSNSKMAVG